MDTLNLPLGESVEVVTDFGGRVESLYLLSRNTGVLRNVLLGHNRDSDAIKDNKYWKGMLLMPYANRIAYVSGGRDWLQLYIL